MFCYNCGKELCEEANLCLHCGAVIHSDRAIERQNPLIPQTDLLSLYNSAGVYEFLESLEPDLDFIWARSGNDATAHPLPRATLSTYILAFNTKRIYICQLSETSEKSIDAIRKYAWNEITSFTSKGSMVRKLLRFELCDQTLSFKTQKLFSMENQSNRIEKLLQMQK